MELIKGMIANVIYYYRKVLGKQQVMSITMLGLAALLVEMMVGVNGNKVRTQLPVNGRR